MLLKFKYAIGVLTIWLWSILLTNILSMYKIYGSLEEEENIPDEDGTK